MRELVHYVSRITETENHQFAEAFKRTFSAFVMIVVLSHLVALAWKP
ncbi:hypothetical protein [Blastochloris viridis]|uniref:Uncharacterized protein n=1 Tax=Blastochloris viridis TaxID=1079 RepID=A0A0H5BEQ2_BLAVI|nr:hypothetical protein [Blastochloris viridis]ALK10490.1 hypothetical protein BVIR_2725 [Blastochloris viridis]BAR99564.1 hypothetical protein BV133_1971 [Blastochloris viridis]CUU43152.1 hypothetical protein BVIRIDIS_21690 [Blastochloris viridis]